MMTEADAKLEGYADILAQTWAQLTRMEFRTLACLGMAAALLACCASVVVPNDPGGRRATLCAARARADVPSMAAIVHDGAAKSEHPTLTKALAYSVGLAPVSAAVWLTQREAYERAFDRCLIETMPRTTP